jgi:uncharacterized protein with HEPN domain
MQRNRPADLLRDILDLIEKIDTWTAALDAIADERTLYAVLHALQYIGEAVSRLPDDAISLAPDVPWRKIRAMRNLIAHDYAGIDTAIIEATVRDRLPELKAAVTTMLLRLPKA